MIKLTRLAALGCALALLVGLAPTVAGKAASIRFATFNASLNRNAAGQALSDLSSPGNA